MGLPMSSVSSSASSSRFFIISSASFHMMRLRLAGGLLAGGDLGQHLAGRRVHAVEGLAAEGGGELAADEGLVAVAQAADAALPVVARKLGAHVPFPSDCGGRRLKQDAFRWKHLNASCP